MKADVLSLYPMPKTSLHIFDHTVKPILLYCAEIWGCYLPKSADFNFMFDYSRLSSVLPCDKLHIHFCKYIENKFLHSQGCDTWYSGLQRLFKIFDNNTGIHNMLKYKHNTFNRKVKVYTKAFYKNKWYVKRNKLLDENGKLRTQMQFRIRKLFSYFIRF